MLPSIGELFQWAYTVGCTPVFRVKISSMRYKNKPHYVLRTQHIYVMTGVSILTGMWFVEFLSPRDKIFTVLPESQKLTVPPVSTRKVTLYRFYRVGKLTFGTALAYFLFRFFWTWLVGSLSWSSGIATVSSCRTFANSDNTVQIVCLDI